MTDLYPLRKFVIPDNYTVAPLTSDIYTDSVIDNLYLQFSCCYGKRISKYVQAQKKGDAGCLDAQTRYLIMALYVLRNWYNPSIKFSFPLNFVSTGPPYYDVSLLLVPYYGSMSLSNPIFEDAQGNTPQQVLTAIQSVLPVNYTASLSDYGDEIIITVTYPFPPSTLPFYAVAQPSTSPGGYNLWFPTTVVSPCILYSEVQNLIENCIKICDCPNCVTLSCLEKDFVYTPVGYKLPLAIAGPTDYTTDIYFN